MDLLGKIAKTLNQITEKEINGLMYMRCPEKVEKAIESVDSLLMKAKPIEIKKHLQEKNK